MFAASESGDLGTLDLAKIVSNLPSLSIAALKISPEPDGAVPSVLHRIRC